MSLIKSPEDTGIMYQVCLRRRDAPDSAAGPQADFPFEGEAGVRPDGVVASQEPCSGKFRRGGRGDLRLTVVPPVDMGTFRDPLNKSPRPSHPRNGRMTALPFAVNSAAIDSKCRLVLHPVPWRAGSRDLFRGSLEWQGLLAQNVQSIRIWRRRVPEHQEIRDIVFES